MKWINKNMSWFFKITILYNFGLIHAACFNNDLIYIFCIMPFQISIKFADSLLNLQVKDHFSFIKALFLFLQHLLKKQYKYIKWISIPCDLKVFGTQKNHLSTS